MRRRQTGSTQPTFRGTVLNIEGCDTANVKRTTRRRGDPQLGLPSSHFLAQHCLGLGDLSDTFAAIISQVGLHDDCAAADV
jgi:hypothetical protein